MMITSFLNDRFITSHRLDHHHHSFFFFFFFFVISFIIVPSCSVHQAKGLEQKNIDALEPKVKEKVFFLGVDYSSIDRVNHKYDREKNLLFNCDDADDADDFKEDNNNNNENKNNNEKAHKISFNQVNDNYCDCAKNGADEPGTNACEKGLFFCENKGKANGAKFIKKSFVNDNVCDCCDGSDELYNKRVTCENTCVKDSLIDRDILAKDIERLENGVKRKEREYYGKILKRKKEFEKERTSVSLEMKKIESEKIKREREEGEADERLKKLEDLKEEERRREREKEDEQKRKSHPTDESKEEREIREMNEEMQEIEREEEEEEEEVEESSASSSSNVGDYVEEETNVKEEEETDEERGRRIAEQWVRDDKSSSSEQKKAEAEAEDVIDGEYDDPDSSSPSPSSYDDYDDDEYDHHHDHDYDDTSSNDDIHQTEDKEEETNVVVENDNKNNKKLGMFGKMKQIVGKLGRRRRRKEKKKKNNNNNNKDNENDDSNDDNNMSEEDKALDTARKTRDKAQELASDCRAKYEETNSKLSTLNKKIERLSSASVDETTKLLISALSDQCFKTTADKYTYEICIFSKAKQDGSVDLGEMKGDDDSVLVLNNRTFMKFTGGERCWNGPSRSMTVELLCGEREDLFDVQEPARCEYRSKFFTPIACDAKDLIAKKRERELLENDDDNSNNNGNDDDHNTIVFKYNIVNY
jgi:protein kinase C substrate 80K-H